MALIQKFEDLEAWKISREVTREIYRISKNQSFARDFGLRDQICRASVSTMSNIAEGFERDGDKEFINFLSIAKASSGEVRSQLYVALDQEYLRKRFQFSLRQDDGKQPGNCRANKIPKTIGFKRKKVQIDSTSRLGTFGTWVLRLKRLCNG